MNASTRKPLTIPLETLKRNRITYLGGTGDDLGARIAVDSSGNAYVTGTTEGSFPTTGGAAQTVFEGGDFDAFVTKLNAAGSALIYSTYLGGTGSDIGLGIAVDSSGKAYVTGYTQAVVPGPADAFATKLSAAGSTVIYSTHLGGSGDGAYGIAVDSSGNAYVTEATVSGFPTTGGAYQTVYGGGGSDGIVAKIGQFAGTPGMPECNGTSTSALAAQFGGIPAAAAALGYPSAQALLNAISAACVKP